VSLRDELDTSFTPGRSRTDVWLDTQTDEFRTEFVELANDRTIGHTALNKLATKYGLKLGSSAFADWRKALWALETN
jgi:hypothetical protein